jgi:O-antigen/teichoic acid export membrane protein
VLAAAVIAASLLPFLLAPIRARLFGPDGRGEFAFFQSSFTILAAVSALGYRHAYYQEAQNTPGYTPNLGRAGKFLTLAVGLAVGLPLSAVAFAEVSAPVGVGLAVAAFGGPLFAYTQLVAADAQWHGRRAEVAALAGGPPTAEFALNILLLFLQKLNVATAMAAAETLRIGTAIFAGGRRKRAPQDSESRSDGLEAADPKNPVRLFSTAALLAPAVLAPLLASNIDAVIYGALGSAVLLGYYAVAKIATSVLILAATTLEGRFLRLTAAKGITYAIGLAVLALGALAVFGAAVGYLVVPPLFGEAFRPSALALPATATAGGAAGLFVLLGAQAARVGHSRAALLTAVSCFVLVAVGCFVISLSGAATPGMMALPMVVGYVVACAILSITLWKNQEARQ